MSYSLYASAYTNNEPGEGICRLDFDGSSITELKKFGDVANPSYITVENGTIFAVEENHTSASVVKIPPSGEMERVTLDGNGLCHAIVVGSFLYVSGYHGGCHAGLNKHTLECVSFIQNTGKGVNPNRQEAPHVHSSIPSPDGKHLIIADLGLDKLFCYDIKEDGKLSANESHPFACVEPGQGPRHLVFHPNGKHLYLATELDSSVVVFGYDEKTSALTYKEKYSLSMDGAQKRPQAADIHITNDGRYLYASVRGQDTIVCFEVSPCGCTLKKLATYDCGGACPRSFDISPDEKYIAVANQSSGDVTVFELDNKTGAIGKAAASYPFPSVSCVKWA